MLLKGCQQKEKKSVQSVHVGLGTPHFNSSAAGDEAHLHLFPWLKT